jgi:hypothetical protein
MFVWSSEIFAEGWQSDKVPSRQAAFFQIKKSLNHSRAGLDQDEGSRTAEANFFGECGKWHVGCKANKARLNAGKLTSGSWGKQVHRLHQKCPPRIL